MLFEVPEFVEEVFDGGAEGRIAGAGLVEEAGAILGSPS